MRRPKMYILEPAGNRPIKESNRSPSIDQFDNRKEQFVRFLKTLTSLSLNIMFRVPLSTIHIIPSNQTTLRTYSFNHSFLLTCTLVVPPSICNSVRFTAAACQCCNILLALLRSVISSIFLK